MSGFIVTGKWLCYSELCSQPNFSLYVCVPSWHTYKQSYVWPGKWNLSASVGRRY